MKYASTLLALFLFSITSHAQVTVGDRPSRAEEQTAKQTLSKLEAKKIALEVGEFEELVPRKGTTTPYLWISNDNSIVTRYEVEKGQGFAVVGKRTSAGQLSSSTSSPRSSTPKTASQFS